MSSGFLKTLGLAIVLTLVLVVVVNVIGDFAVRPKPGYSPGKIAEKAAMPEQPVVAQTAPTPAPAPEDLSALLAGIDPALGKKTFRRCKGCHTSSKDARNLIGPNLWNIVGRAKGSQDGYRYSKAVAGLGGDWSYDDLDAFLSDPRGFAKGTKMMFKGMSRPAQRAEIIGYLRSLSDNPKPLP